MACNSYYELLKAIEGISKVGISMEEAAKTLSNMTSTIEILNYCLQVENERNKVKEKIREKCKQSQPKATSPKTQNNENTFIIKDYDLLQLLEENTYTGPDTGNKNGFQKFLDQFSEIEGNPFLNERGKRATLQLYEDAINTDWIDKMFEENTKEFLNV